MTNYQEIKDVRFPLALPRRLKQARELHPFINLARKYHNGQTDKSGASYIAHPLAVMRLVEGHDAKVVAVLHDVLEDTDASYSDLLHVGVDDEQMEALKLLRHDKGLSYEEYIRRLKDNPLASYVKRADIAHNNSPKRLAKLPVAERDRLHRKYELALEILDE